jgi:DNA-binding beta-propeller fold protein YncE
MSPDGRFGYIPERDADSVTKFDVAKREIVKTVPFPAGSKPYMLRVSPDGKEVWVQSGVTNSNYVLNAEDLSTLATEPCGKGPVTNAWSPDRKYSIVTNSNDTFAQVFDAKTYKEVKRLNVGQGGSNIGFTRDGAFAFISVTGANAVAVIDMARLDVVEQLKAGAQPTGLIVR